MGRFESETHFMPEFIPGLELARSFYLEVVSEIVRDISHSAALLGYGSEVIGLDTERSTDHGWGPRLQIFVLSDDVAPLLSSLESRLPSEFKGWPVRFGWDDVPTGHRVEVFTFEDFLMARFPFDPRQNVSVLNWLLTPQQLLLEFTSGAVFHDGLDVLERSRRALEWYPNDVWLYLLASQWKRIAQEEAFVGRTAEVGDELGSRVITARLVRDVMRLCFLLERRYAPYSKWLGSAFQKLDSAAAVGPKLESALDAGAYPAREASLVAAYEFVAGRQNDLGMFPEVDTLGRLYHSRPFLVLGADRFANACRAAIEDEWLRKIPLVGGVDQFADSTDVLSHGQTPHRLAEIYD